MKTCESAWLADASKARAENFDRTFPKCCCEEHSLGGCGRPVNDDELLARIFTTPDTYSNDTHEIIWNKLVRVYSDGLSTFRSGCTEEEIRSFVDRLTTGGAEPTSLAGATLIRAANLRQAGDPCRWFCVYDTSESQFSCHADLIGTWPDASSKTKLKAEQASRMRSLRTRFSEAFLPSATVEELLEVLRLNGFVISAN